MCHEYVIVWNNYRVWPSSSSLSGICTQKCDGGAEEDHWWQWDHKGRWRTVAASWQSWQTGLWLYVQIRWFFMSNHSVSRSDCFTLYWPSVSKMLLINIGVALHWGPVRFDGHIIFSLLLSTLFISWHFNSCDYLLWRHSNDIQAINIPFLHDFCNAKICMT